MNPWMWFVLLGLALLRKALALLLRYGASAA